jgi:RsiW-degrading membrane proteinase PrsW (M82 family)
MRAPATAHRPLDMPDKSYIYYAIILAWAVALLWRVYQHDKYEKEPWWMLLAALAGGFVVMMFLEGVELAVMKRLGFESGFAWKLALAAALVEDLARAALIVALAIVCHKFVNDPLDGMIYGMLIGLGMAAAESLDHVMGVGARRVDTELVAGELFRFIGHCFLGGIVGFAILEATPESRPRIRPTRILLCFFAAAAPHFVIDYGNGIFSRLGVAVGFTSAFLLWSLMLLVAGRRSYVLFGRGFEPVAGKANARAPAP